MNNLKPTEKLVGPHNESLFSRNYHRGKNGNEKTMGRPKMMLLDYLMKKCNKLKERAAAGHRGE